MSFTDKKFLFRSQAHLPEVVVEKCHFGAMTSDMVRQLSVVQITQTQTFDRTSLEPMDNGRWVCSGESTSSISPRKID